MSDFFKSEPYRELADKFGVDAFGEQWKAVTEIQKLECAAGNLVMIIEAYKAEILYYGRAKYSIQERIDWHLDMWGDSSAEVHQYISTLYNKLKGVLKIEGEYQEVKNEG